MGGISSSILTGKRPNKAWGSDDACHVTTPEPGLQRPAMCLRCFRPWRLAGLPVVPKCLLAQQVITRTDPPRRHGPPAFVHAPESAAQKAQGSPGTAVCARLARSPLLTKYGLPLCHIWKCTSRRSLYKAGNPPPSELTEPKFKSRPPVTKH